MKIVSKIYSKVLLAAVVAVGAMMSSCTDYLTIIPADKVVEENFWQTKDQVNGMLATSYIKLFSTDAVRKAIIWGEVRSDDMSYPSNSDYNPEVKDIIEAEVDYKNSYCNWGVYYEAISSANLVLECAGKARQTDPDFTEGDSIIVSGEMYAMRALCHFYLVRTFRDIPLATRSAKNDAEMPDYVQVHPLEALNHIMADLDKAKDMVMKSGAYTDPAKNLGRISRNAVLAIMADVNLWRAAFAKYYEDDTERVKPGDVQRYYDECVQNCQDLLDDMDATIEKENEGNQLAETYPYNLIPNRGDGLKSSLKSTAYDEIFGSGKNSSESIFELQISSDNTSRDQTKGALAVYGTDNDPNLVAASKKFIKDYYAKDDLRAYSFTNLNSFDDLDKEETVLCVTKYVAKKSPAAKEKDYRKSGEWDANWIVYRRTDVMLMMAEAMVTRENATQKDMQDAFNIVYAINTRSRCDSTAIEENELIFEDYPTAKDMQELVRDERARELAFEGKRWYDLVRLALMEKSTASVKFVADKLKSGGVVKIKMANIDCLFLPIFHEELRYNKNLKQNPEYDDDDSLTELN